MLEWFWAWWPIGQARRLTIEKIHPMLAVDRSMDAELPLLALGLAAERFRTDFIYFFLSQSLTY
jgi:hypothetical protein